MVATIALVPLARALQIQRHDRLAMRARIGGQLEMPRHTRRQRRVDGALVDFEIAEIARSSGENRRHGVSLISFRSSSSPSSSSPWPSASVTATDTWSPSLTIRIGPPESGSYQRSLPSLLRVT